MGKSPFSSLSSKEHQLLAKDSFFVSEGPFSLRFKKTPQKRGLAVVISGKVITKAVERNKYRRIIKVIFSEESEKIPPQISCVVLVRKKITPIQKDVFEGYINSLLKKAFG